MNTDTNFMLLKSSISISKDLINERLKKSPQSADRLMSHQLPICKVCQKIITDKARIYLADAETGEYICVECPEHYL